MSTTGAPPHGCQICGDDCPEEVRVTCRICTRHYHLKCADVAAAKPTYGCLHCFEFPGNNPRRIIRDGPANNVVGASGVDAADGGHHNGRSNLGEDNGGDLKTIDNQLDTIQRLPSHSPANNQGAPGHGALARHEKTEHDDPMMRILQFMEDNTKRLETLENKSSRHSSTTTPNRDRVTDWVSQNSQNSQRPPAPAPSVSQESQYSGTEWDSRREDLALRVTRITTTDEFRECLRQASRGVPGVPVSYSYGKKPPALPKFSGGDLEWLEFIAYYLETTQEYKVSDLKNVERLRAALSGEPLRILNDTMIYASALPDALDQLRVTYGDPLRIVASLEKELIATEPVSQDGVNLQKLLIKAKRFVNYVEACGYNDLMTSRSLLTKLQAKLPFCMALRWGDKLAINKGTPTLKLFSQYLNEDFERALAAGRAEVRMSKRAPAKVMTTVEVSQPNQKSKQPARAPANPAEAECPMCKGSHVLIQCPTFKSATDADRMQIVDDARLCWSCLQARTHGHRQCKARGKCGVDNCGQKHHPLLHAALTIRYANRQEICAITMDYEGVMFKIMPVKLFCDGQEMDTYCFIDEGSSVSLLDTSAADRLGAKGPTQSLTIKWANDQCKTDAKSRTVKFQIAGADGQRYEVNNVRTVSDLELPHQTLGKEVVTQMFPRGDGPLPFDDAMPKLLLGLNHAHLAVPRKVIERRDSPLIALKTRLGWLIYGASEYGMGVASLNYRVCHMSTPEDQEIKEKLQEFFEIESFGVKPAPPQLSKKDARAMDVLKRTIKHTGERYEAGLLWASDHVRLPESKRMCMKRTIEFRRKMKRNPELALQMRKQVEDYLAKGYCVDVAGVEPKEPTFYLPVFPVTKKPGKFRMVHDGAAKTYTGESLNSFLLSGPDLLNPLPAVLMRFREKEVAFSADVSEMFHQVRIRETDRDAQRFLFWGPEEEKPRELRMEVMMFGATCSPTTAQFVQRSNAELFRKQYPEAVEEILKNYYVDDGLSSVIDVPTARKVLSDMILIQKHAGYELKKIRSSHSAVVATPDSPVKEFTSEGGSVLGMSWDSGRDTLQFRVAKALELKDTAPLTRRKMLSGTMSLFDPLGLVANVVVKAKMLMKCCLGEDWDAEVSPELQQKWRDWCEILIELMELPIPRWLGLTHSSPWELHVFVDASQEAFAAVAYVRGRAVDGQVVCRLVMAKTRVAPVKALTMPRMELQAAVLGTRLALTVRENTQMDIRRRVMWTDSTDVKCWIQSSHRRYHPYVAARINEILDSTKEEEWRWVPTLLNVADDATRFASPIEYERWFNGPAFLYDDETEWPAQPNHKGTPKEEIAHVLTIKDVPLGLLPEAERFSLFRRLVNSTAYALRFFYKEKQPSRVLLPEELQRAEREIFRAAQRTEFMELIKNLKDDPNHVTSKKHPLHKACPLLDENQLLRVDGRLPDKLFPVEVRQPIILPKKSPVTVLFVKYMHARYLHGNHETVLNEIKRFYYIPGVRRLLKKIVKDCLHCQIKKRRVVPPRQGKLPEARAAVGWKCFTYCGLDYFGPFNVSVGRRQEKRWVALFTCMTTRAVHVEVVHSLNLDSCLMAVRNMCSRRNVMPTEIRSDCGTNFKATDKELQRFASMFPRITWTFNTPGSPHMGGAWERMVQTVDRCFTEVVGNRVLMDEVLRCALIEAEWCVNSHPLTHVGLEDDDEPALTPHDFLHGAFQQRSLNDIVMDQNEGQFLRKSWRMAQQIADHFCRRFQREVIPILNLPTKWYERAEPLAVGDVVMVADDQQRGAWRKGIVVEAIKGKKDDQVRQVQIKTAKGMMARPVVKVAKVDVHRQG